ncbi:MAG: OmpH family outer membrane protein [Acidobacteriota bacterium]|nr:OmpH family outer membrane protein [Acidobacteriota bacterium]
MKLIRYTATAAAFAALTAFTVNAQQPGAATTPARPAPSRPAASTTPAPTGSTVIAESKIAIINTAAFGAKQGGIARLVTAMGGVDREFEPRRTELRTLQTNYEKLVEDINKQKELSTPQALQQKADQAESMKRDIERKQQDAQLAFDKRMRETVAPVYEDIGKSLDTYAKERGITVILDAAKLGEAMFIVNDGIDITAAFVAFYNQRPAGAASTATPR